MFYNSKDCSVRIDDSFMHYVSFGHGDKNLIIILGLGEGLKSPKGQGRILAAYYKRYAREG